MLIIFDDKECFQLQRMLRAKIKPAALVVTKLTPTEPTYKYIEPENQSKSGTFHKSHQLHNSSANYAREMFKPLKDSASLRVCNEIKIFGFFMNDIIMLPGLEINS